MGKFVRKVRKSCLVGMILIAIGLVFYLIMTFISSKTARSMTTEFANESWSEEESAQISCYFEAGEAVTPDSIIGFRHTLEDNLEQESITPANEKAKLFVDSYSAEGELSLKNGKTTVTVDAFGTAGDFFRFHPAKLLTGSYYTEANIMNDYILIDQDVAWQLFGSYDVTGMTVDIGGKSHFIAGVFQREEGKLYEAAGYSKASAYVSYQTLSELGTTSGITAYQIIMPNPVSGYALNKIKELAISNKDETIFVENSGRYGDWNMLLDLRNFGVSSMKTIPVRLPYWENVALAIAEKIKLYLVFRLIFVLLAFVGILMVVRDLWKHRRWRLKDIPDLVTRIGDSIRDKKRKKGKRRKKRESKV